MFSDNFLKNLKPQASRYDRHEAGGFYIRVFPTGTKTFFFRCQQNGKPRRITIGNYPTTSLKDARQKYRQISDAFKRGEDPEKAQPEGITAKTLFRRYIKEYAEPNKRSWKEDERILEKDIIPAWGDRSAESITRSDVIALLRGILARGAPRVSNITLTIIRRVFAWGISHDLLQVSNPCLEVEPLGKENRKDRYLSEVEIKIFWETIGTINMVPEAVRVLRLILTTAQRPGEVAGMHSKEIDGRWWTIPAERTKNKKSHRVYLSDLALELIDDRSGFVCASTAAGRGKMPLNKKTLPTILKRRFNEGRLLLSPFTPHDLRRTAATQMGALGYHDFLIGRVLNHTEQSITGRYNLYAYDSEKQEILTVWGRRLKEIIK